MKWSQWHCPVETAMGAGRAKSPASDETAIRFDGGGWLNAKSAPQARG